MTPAPRKSPKKGARPAPPTLAAGPPGGLSYALRTEAPAVRAVSAVTARFEGAEIEHLFAFDTLSPDPAQVDVKVQLRPETPPGTYRGTATVGDTDIPIVAEVAARPHGRAQPSRLQLEVAPGGTAEARVELTNTGNVPLRFDGTSTFTLLGERGFDEALFAAIDPDLPPERQRIEVLLGELADSQGGEVEVRPTCSADAVAPGETATLDLELRFSDRIRPGHTYTGAWKPDGLRLRFTVTGTEPSPTREAEIT